MLKEWLAKKIAWLKENVFKVLTIPAIISCLTFLLSLSGVLQDGVLTQDEFSRLVSTSSGIESVILVIAMIIWGRKK